jgi:hypothetical protein
LHLAAEENFSATGNTAEYETDYFDSYVFADTSLWDSHNTAVMFFKCCVMGVPNAVFADTSLWDSHNTAFEEHNFYSL